MKLLFCLLVAHALADFSSLQSEVMAREKNWSLANVTTVPWPYWLSAHALIHGGAVALVTGIWWLGVAETAVHWMIDYGKCGRRFGIHTDQVLHGACKLLWWGLA